MKYLFAFLLFTTPVFADNCTYDSDGRMYSCASPGGIPSTPPPGTWHLFTQTEGGTVSLLHGLSKRTCEFAMNRALGLPATDEEREAEQRRNETEMQRAKEFCALPKEKRDTIISALGISCNADGTPNPWRSTFHVVSPGDIRRAECFQ